jgi:hypothetical protein
MMLLSGNGKRASHQEQARKYCNEKKSVPSFEYHFMAVEEQ